MGELRQNLLTKRWVTIAADRAQRPNELIAESKPSIADLPGWEPGCPFCPGNEERELEVECNYLIRTAPLHDEGNDYMHWYVTVVPRVTRSAGFELGSGMFINTTLPEESAAFLRSVKI